MVYCMYGKYNWNIGDLGGYKKTGQRMGGWKIEDTGDRTIGNEGGGERKF